MGGQDTFRHCAGAETHWKNLALRAGCWTKPAAAMLSTLRLAGFSPVKRAEHRRKSGGFPSRLSGGVADAPFRGGPDFREAQGTTVAAGGGRARVPGRLSLLTFFGEAKKVSRHAGRTPAPISPRAQRDA